LPADVREQILAELPPPEERERLYREIQEKGGMSGDEFFKSLGIEVHPQSFTRSFAGIRLEIC
jgi:hypothetical protein